jgi:hypothetical protein
MTYDVDHEDLHGVLSHAGDVSTLVQCAIALHDNKPLSLSAAPIHLQIMIYRDRRIAHKLQPHLLKCIVRDWHGFDLALENVWSSYQAGAMRKVMEDERWLCVETASSGSIAQCVHYDLIDGVLLIDGKSLGRLPHEYIIHPTYTRTFGTVRPYCRCIYSQHLILTTVY